MNVLSKLQIDELKIDRIFLHTKSEVDNQRTKWKNLGADVGQGYFYGRPLSISAFNDLIETK